MAISLTQTPQLYTPAYNTNQFVALSTLASAHPDFIYVVDVTYFTAGFNTLSYQFPKRPDNYAVFDVQEAVKNAIKHTFNPDSMTPFLAQYKSVGITVTVTENYGGVNYASVSHSYYVFDACLKESVFKDYNFNNYVSGYTHPVSFISPDLNDWKQPTFFPNKNNDVWMTFYAGQVQTIGLRGYNNSGTLTNSTTLTLPSPAPDKIYTMNIGYRVLNFYSIPLVPGGFVEIEFYNSLGATLELLTYGLANSCSKHIQYTVYYLKRNGSTGFFNFGKLSQENVSLIKNTVRSNRNKLVSGVYGYNTYDREKQTISTLTTRKITLATDWITQLQSEYLEELFDSPLVWLSAPNNLATNSNYIPIDNTETTYTLEKHANKPLFNLSMTFDYSTNETRQRGI